MAPSWSMMASRLTRRSLGPDLVDEHHAAVEIAHLAGQALVDRIRDDMRDTAPDVGRGEILRAGELLGGGHIPQPEFRLQPAVALARDAAGDQRLGVDGAPIGKPRQRVDVRDPLDIGRGIDRREQAGALQVGGDHLRDVARDVAVVRAAADEIRNRDRDRLDVALGDVDADDRAGGARAQAEAAPRAPASSGAGEQQVRCAVEASFEPYCSHADVPKWSFVSRRTFRAGRR